ncbi:hypothetical protein GLOTRDRAFT_134548 [Gloeophyllum trabeum ATCC 11539]|uniref:Uncharacterized protein n=1 Tax=Gloeophyllum trabeum (strain ATCC 11539 / FP-39264 / Madison 617) TaxID=670483 RepID=S7PQU4_GLOTA|nr:uncharacterized protein GLOTRDRAFT_134548 [Gloeophyllum trabeum ATCC 11539]EPQ49838.1 hypothetical protein GLOTRDRAFT_134548 [Gloeophyllum trabeum ATCC 11539]
MVEKATGAYSQEFMDKAITFMKDLCTGGGQGTLSHCDLAQGRLQTPLNVRRLPADEIIYYAVTPPDGPGVWVTTAADVCHIIRIYRYESSRGDAQPDLRLRLLDLGIPFLCPRVLPHPQKTVEPGSLVQQLVRSPGYKWVPADYASYVSRRDSFIVGHPHGRAALLLGGMMWRLALDALHGTAEDVVCAGPSEAAIENGFGRLVTRVDGTSGWYEEHIDPLEEACIIGTYFVETSPGQWAEISWWPKSTTWKCCGYGSPGYWTNGAEEWYQNRLREIMKGTAQPMSQMQWRSFLRHNASAVRKFSGRYESHCKLSVDAR